MRKIDKVRCNMRDLNIDAVIIHDELNQRYLTEFAFSDGILLVTLSKAFIVTDFRYYEMALSTVSSDFQVVMPEKRAEFMNDVFSAENIITVGLEGGYLSYASYSAYKDRYEHIRFVDIGDMLGVLRQVKSKDELDKMQKAQDITDAAFSHLLSVLKPDMTEMDVAAELEYAMKKGGAEGMAFSTIAVSGDSSALPHGVPRNVKLKRGFLTMDFGAKYDGYCSDMTRTVVIGLADADIRHLYSTVLNAQQAAMEYLRYGRDCGEADKAARDIIEGVDGYRGAFGHSLGHSVGLLVHEKPSLSPKAFGKKLVSGNVVTVEPGIYLFGKYGCRIENMVAIEENGIYNFTHSSTELIEIV